MEAQEYKPLTVGDWILTHIVLAIPLVGLIMLFVWGFGDSTQPSKKSYCQSLLILAACFLVLAVILIVAFGGFAAIMSQMEPRPQIPVQ